jgi:hypothetical protein
MSAESDDLELHLHLHEDSRRRRKLSFHLHLHDCGGGERTSQPDLVSSTEVPTKSDHDLHSPVAVGDNPAVRIASNSDAAYICAHGSVADSNLVNCKVYAAVYRTIGEVPPDCPPTSGLPFGVISNTTGEYEIPRVENVLLGSNTNVIGVWPVDFSGVTRHHICRRFTVVESSGTICEQSGGMAPMQRAPTGGPEVYLASIASPEDLLAHWPEQPIALRRVTPGLWSAQGPWQIKLRVFRGASGIEAELVLSALGDAVLKMPEIWRAAPFYSNECNIFYWMTRDASIHVPAAILLKPQ